MTVAEAIKIGSETKPGSLKYEQAIKLFLSIICQNIKLSDPVEWWTTPLDDTLDIFESPHDDVITSIIHSVSNSLKLNEQFVEEIIKTNPKTAYHHALWRKRSRWPAGEEIIKTDPEWAYMYAFNIIKGRCRTTCTVKRASVYCRG